MTYKTEKASETPRFTPAQLRALVQDYEELLDFAADVLEETQALRSHVFVGGFCECGAVEPELCPMAGEPERTP